MEGILIGIIFLIITYKKKMLTLGGAIVVAIMLSLIYFGGGWSMLFMIVWAYLTLSVVDKIFEKKIYRNVSNVHEKTGTRDAYQVIVNGVCGTIALVINIFVDSEVCLLVYLVAIGEAYADSLASDVGVLSKKSPIDIITFRPVKNGISGGVSFLGCAASVTGMFVYSAIIYLITDLSFVDCSFVFLISIIGCLFDSILGSRIQNKNKCVICGELTEKMTCCNISTKHCGGIKYINNSMVNLMSNIFACLVMILVGRVL